MMPNEGLLSLSKGFHTKMSYGTTMSQVGSYDEDFISPISPIGGVILNGCMANGSVISAQRNATPFYPMPSGSATELVGRTRNTAIVYRLIDEEGYLSNSYQRPSNTAVAGLSSLNGQGQAGESQAQFMSRIAPIGIANQDTEVNGSSLFNIYVGGIHTVINNSNRDIVAGDWIMAYNPRPEEVSQGGRGKEADANGYVELWMVPYHPSIHQITTAHIYQCLTMRYNDRGKSHAVQGRQYLQEYETMCDHLLDSFMDFGLIFTEFLATRGFITVNKDEMSGTPTGNLDERATAYAKLFSRLDHSHFTSKKQIEPELRKALVDAFFVTRLSTKDATEGKSDFFVSKTKTDIDMRKLRDCQREASSICLMETTRFAHTITKNVIGKATTSAAPKKNFNLQLCSMIGCK